MDIKTLHNIFLSCSSVTTDSRNCPEGSIFFALKGESFNGNQFADKAIEAGAKYAVVDENTESISDNIILVDNVLKTLQDLANYHRRWLGIPILAITGTNGKTTTKELTREVLKQKFEVKATEGNFNNHIGVPLTLLSFNQETEFGVVEMGANHPGEIAFLCNIAEPDFGLITNIGKAHLEGFGSLNGVMQTKGELYNYLSKNAGTIFSNKDNPYLYQMLPENTDVIFYGIQIQNNDVLVSGKSTGKEFFLKLTWQNNNTGNQYDLNTNLIGDYNLENVLAAITVGCFFNIEEKKINSAVTGYIPSNNRSQYLKTEKNEILLDAYNANPTSMQKALDNFRNIDGTQKALILGGMKELGYESSYEHKELINKIKNINAAIIFLVGPEFVPTLTLIPEAVHFKDVNELIKYIKENPVTNHKILIKGSRNNKLEKVITYL
ncbi:MAG: UDP-N-acetylmuramoyl-tripeptide--D-alanyl-D-alanine ligase [Chlorobi bacterium]|nr:UDP-N-acetylmuramoyl-tripeptide--D-alanyl-D-alanine ligase [Chlorobiota bacterium]